jgi:hypothetical protein
MALAWRKAIFRLIFSMHFKGEGNNGGSGTIILTAET